MITSEHVDKLWPAIVKARQAMKGPKKGAENPGFKREGKPLKYADLAACIEAADDAGGPQGLVTLQELTSDSAGVCVSTLIVHESGQWVKFEPLFIPANKQDAQGFGSAASYARRYSIKAAWNMADEDDDGNAAVAKHTQAEAAGPPAGYADWLVDLETVASDGTAALQETWKSSPAAYRSHLTSTNPKRWESIKARAAKGPQVAA